MKLLASLCAVVFCLCACERQNTDSKAPKYHYQPTTVQSESDVDCEKEHVMDYKWENGKRVPNHVVVTYEDC